MTTIATLDPLITAPYNDPDEEAFAETPVAKEIEWRVAGSPPGSGALIERRTSTNQITEAERTGRQLHDLETTTGWVGDANVSLAAYSATFPTGYSGTNLEVQFTGASAVDRAATYTFATPLDLSAFDSGTIIRLHRRFTSVTNLTSIQIIFRTSVGNVYNAVIAAPADTINVWTELSLSKFNFSTAGTPSWASIVALGIFADVSGAYTGNIELRDLRIGSTLTDKTVPDGHLASEELFDVRARYLDNASAKVSGGTLAANSAVGATNVKYTAGQTYVVNDTLTIKTTGFYETRIITAVGTSGGGGTGLTLDEALQYAHTNGDAIASHYWGAWSAWVPSTKVSLPPVVAASTPADFAVITDPTQALVHTFTSPGGKAQDRRMLELLRERGYLNFVRAMGPSSLWELDEAAGNFIDTMGITNLALTGGATRAVTGPLAPSDNTGALDFDGTGYAQGGDFYDFAGVAPFFVGGWFRLDGATGNPRLISKEAVAGHGWYIYWDNVDGFVKLVRKDIGLASDTATSAQTIAVDATTWHFVVGWFNGGTMQLILDGVMGTAVASSRNLTDNGAFITLGRQAATAANNLNGPVFGWFTKDSTSRETGIAAFATRMEVPGIDLVYSLTTSGTGLTDTTPILLFDNLAPYVWRKTAWDTDNLSGITAERTFFTNFNAVAAPTNLTAVADPTTGGVTLTWDASTDPNYSHTRIYWINDAGQRVRLDGGPVAVDDGRTLFTATTFTHYGARLGVNSYQVTHHDGAIESDPATVEVTQTAIRAGSWQLNGDGVARYTFAFDPDDAPRRSNPQVEVLRPPGRGSAIHRHWGTGGTSVSLRLTYIPTEDGHLATVLREMLGAPTGPAVPAWLISPAGYGWDPIRVLLTDVQDTPARGGFVGVALELDETPFTS